MILMISAADVFDVGTLKTETFLRFSTFDNLIMKSQLRNIFWYLKVLCHADAFVIICAALIIDFISLVCAPH